MPRDLDADLKMLQLVLALAQRREIARAAAIAEKELAGGFEHPLLLNVLATRLEQEGRLEEAVGLLGRAVALAPDDVPARNALALCLQRLDRPAEALHEVDELLRRHPDVAFAHANRGNALIALGALAQARASHLRALELDPNSFGSMAALASIASIRGDYADSRTWAERALARAPGFPDAVLSLAAADLFDGRHGDAERAVRGLIADARARPIDHARAQGLLGDILDGAARYGEAFDAYRACNEALRRIYAPYAQGATVLDYARSLRRALRDIAPQWRREPAAMASTDTAAPRHVFLIGFPRSGTTLLEVVLDGHPGVVSLEEHELLTDGVMRFMREPLDLAPLAMADEATLEGLRRDYWGRVAAAGVDPRDKLFIDKHPLNTLKLPLIARLFPHARILFASRDPRDVVLSCFRRRFRMNPAMYQLLSLTGAAQFYSAVMAFAEAARPVLGIAWYEVRYEQLMAEFSAEMQTVCRFLGVSWNENMGAFAERVRTREHSTPSTAQLSRGLDRSGVGHWRNYASALAEVEPELSVWVDRLAAGGAAPQR